MSAILQGVPGRQNLTAVSYLDGVAAPDHFSNGIPYEVDKRLAVTVDGAIDHYHQGLGFTATGRLAVTLTGPPTRFNSGAAPMSATGHLVFALGANAHYVHGLGYTPNSSVNSTGDAPIVLDYNGTGLVGDNGNNFLIGTATGTPPTPSTIDGFEVFYVGSFGQFFWNVRMGAAGTDRPFNASSVDVQVNGTSLANLPWNVTQSRFQDSAGAENLWGILGPELGNTVPWTLNFKL